MSVPVRYVREGNLETVEARLPDGQHLVMHRQEAVRLAESIIHSTGRRYECPCCGECSLVIPKPLTPREPEDVAF